MAKSRASVAIPDAISPRRRVTRGLSRRPQRQTLWVRLGKGRPGPTWQPGRPRFTCLAVLHDAHARIDVRDLRDLHSLSPLSVSAPARAAGSRRLNAELQEGERVQIVSAAIRSLPSSVVWFGHPVDLVGEGGERGIRFDLVDLEVWTDGGRCLFRVNRRWPSEAGLESAQQMRVRAAETEDRERVLPRPITLHECRHTTSPRY